MLRHKNLTPEKAAAKFIAFAEEEGKCKLSGNTARCEQLKRQMDALLLEMREDRLLTVTALKRIMLSSSRRARSLGAIEALRRHVLVDMALHTLEETARANDVLGLASQRALKVWSGELHWQTL